MNQDFRRVFHGLELTARKRMSNKWMMNGSVTLNSATYNAPPEGYQDTIAGDIFGVAALPMDPTNREFIKGQQTLINGTRWIAKMSSLYELPWGINVASTLNARQDSHSSRTSCLRTDPTVSAALPLTGSVRAISAAAMHTAHNRGHLLC